MFTDAFSADSQLLSIDPKQSTFLASSVIARGPLFLSDIRRNIDRYIFCLDRIRKQLTFVPWNSDGWKTGLCDLPPLGQSHSILCMSNNTAVWRVLHRLEERFSKLYKRKAHLHHYLEYMQQQEFIEAQSHVKNILNSYREME